MGTYIVTGGASGIGAAIKRQLESEGNQVLVVDIQQADITANLGTAEGRRAAIEEIRAVAANGLAGLVTCAGVGSHVPDCALITAVNYFGTVELINGLRDVLSANKAPVLLVSSNSAPMPTNPEFVQKLLKNDEAAAVSVAQNMELQPVYSGTKQAVTLWMRRHAAEFATDGIRMNAIAPGYTRTPLSAAVEDDPTYGEAIKQFIESIPLGRPGLPEDMAHAAGFLLGEKASFICGAMLFIDGGHDAMMFSDRI